MHKEIAEKWVAELRSGKYPQTTRYLRDGAGFCCLGVLCEVALKNDVKLKITSDRMNGIYSYDDEENVLPNRVRWWAGVKEHNPNVPEPYAEKIHHEDHEYEPESFSYLAELNDNGYTFDEIADIIEKHYEAL